MSRLLLGSRFLGGRAAWPVRSTLARIERSEIRHGNPLAHISLKLDARYDVTMLQQTAHSKYQQGNFMRSCFRAVLPLAAAILYFSAPARAQLQNENLLVTMPDGYKVGFRDKNDTRLISEMVPTGQSVENWTEMLTVQIFYDMKATPEQFRQRFAKDWADKCKGSQSNPVGKGDERGYPVSIWIQFCPKNPDTGKPEFTILKAIGGNDSFYVVQKAFRFKPDKAQIQTWSRFLRDVYVCDSRVAGRTCPATGKS